MTWPATEYYFFTRRPFAAGHALFLAPHAFTTARDQELMLEWLDRGRAPVALVNETRAEQFARAYPRIDAYLRASYVPIARYEIYDGSRIAINVRRDLKSTGTYCPDAWPCGFESASRQ